MGSVGQASHASSCAFPFASASQPVRDIVAILLPKQELHVNVEA